MTTKSERALEDWRAGDCDLRTALEALATDDEVGTNIRLAVGAALEEGIAKPKPEFDTGDRVRVRATGATGRIERSEWRNGSMSCLVRGQWWRADALVRPAPTITVGELIDALRARPTARYVIGLSDKTGYVNVTSLTAPSDPDAALVIELSEDYDSRQW